MNTIDQDFQRDVYCLFGLAVDNLTMASTRALLNERAKEERGIVLSTLNVNWMVLSFANPEFRNAILNSDIVTLDGKPLLWLSKLFGYPMKELVSGSTLMQELHRDKSAEKPLSIFLFGGEEGTARQAMENINRDPGGLRAVGALNPGFGTVEEMSSNDIIGAINKTEPDILLIALGAQKGMRWIEFNRHRLHAGIISHLGATINFLAGTVQRAPVLFRKCGMEWFCRVIQEPKLFSRYLFDGLVMLHMLTVRLPSLWQYLSQQKHFSRKLTDTNVEKQENDREITLSFGRNVRLSKDSPIRSLLSTCAQARKDISLDFQKTEFADGAFIALLLILMKHKEINGNKIRLINVHGNLSKMLRFLTAGELAWKR
jgi:N-acetylglucosaminyldiphosphoundecaprenol N-acetyl-beta-D-mannosaminyltransferase